MEKDPLSPYHTSVILHPRLHHIQRNIAASSIGKYGKFKERRTPCEFTPIYATAMHLNKG